MTMRRTLIIADFIAGAKQATDPPNPHPDETWQKRMEDSHKNKPEDPAKKNPPGMYTKSPSSIAVDLKNHSKDYDEAQKKLNSYINRQGKNLQGGDRKRLYDAKDHLKMNYGIHEDSNGNKIGNSGSETTALVEQPIYALPPGHNLDDSSVDLMDVVPDNREKILKPMDPQLEGWVASATARLRASVQNTTQNPSTRMSSVEEVDSGSTAVNNIDESGIAGGELGPEDWAIGTPNPIDQAGAQLTSALAAFGKF